MARAVQQLFPIFVDASGNPVDNGYVYIGTANQNPITNPVTVYWDQAETITATQPLRTMGGVIYRNGTPANVFVDGDASILLRDENSQLIWSLPSQPTPVMTAFGESLVATDNAAEAQVILELEPGVDVQEYSAETPTEDASEAQMRAGVETDLLSMSPKLVADAIDELGDKVRVSVADTTPRYLASKVVDSSTVVWSIDSPAGDENLQADVIGAIVKEAQVPAAGETALGIVTGLPAGINGVTVSWFGLEDLSVGDAVYIRLGNVTEYETTGYVSTRVDFAGADTYARVSATSGFQIGGSAGASMSGSIRITRIGGNNWVAEGSMGSETAGGYPCLFHGSKALSDELTRVGIFCATALTSGTISAQYW